jgi:hypothetical protein
MNSNSVNPINMIIGIIVGWFVASFLQAFGSAIFFGGWSNLISYFKQIAFFKDGFGALINVIIIVVCGTVGTITWLKMRKTN